MLQCFSATLKAALFCNFEANRWADAVAAVHRLHEDALRHPTSKVSLKGQHF